MKIYKPTFEDFLEEVRNHVYILTVSESVGSNPIRALYVCATGYNQDDKPMEYCTFIGESFNNNKEVLALADSVIRDMRRKVANLNLSYSPGKVSDKRITGDPYRVDKPGEKPDLSEFTKNIDGEPMPDMEVGDAGNDTDGDFDHHKSKKQ